MPATLQFLQSASDNANLSTYTFASQNLGTAASDRFIIVCYQSRTGGANGIGSVTIGGVSAALTRDANTGGPANVAGIAIAKVPSGTTGDVIVVFSATAARCAIQVYRATGINQTAIDTDGSTASNPSVTVDTAAGGIVIGSFVGAGLTTCSWTGLSEDSDFQVEFQITVSSASLSPSTAGSLFVQATAAVTGPALAVAAFSSSESNTFMMGMPI
jgi:hypothetical protein